jgi:hypothetical protein
MATSATSLPVVSTVESSTHKLLLDFDMYSKALMVFETSVMSFGKGAGVVLGIRALSMEGSDICATLSVPAPPLLPKTSGPLRVFVTVHTDTFWSVDIETDAFEDESMKLEDLAFMIHTQYAHSLVKLCMETFLDTVVALDWY